MKTRRPFDRSSPERQPTAPRPWSRLARRRCRPAVPRSPSSALSWRGASPEAPSSCLTSSARRARPVWLRAARQYQRMRRRLRSECLRLWQTLCARGQARGGGLCATAPRSPHALAPPSATPGVPRAAVGRIAAQRKVTRMAHPFVCCDPPAQLCLRGGAQVPRSWRASTAAAASLGQGAPAAADELRRRRDSAGRGVRRVLQAVLYAKTGRAARRVQFRGVSVRVDAWFIAAQDGACMLGDAVR